MTKTYVGPPSPSPGSVSFQHLTASQRSNSCFKETWPVSSKMEERAASFLTSPQQGHTPSVRPRRWMTHSSPWASESFRWVQDAHSDWVPTITAGVCVNSIQILCRVITFPFICVTILFHGVRLESMFYRRGN